MADDDKIGISFPMDRDMHLRLKLATSASGVSIKDYIIGVLDDALPKISRNEHGDLVFTIPDIFLEEIADAVDAQAAETVAAVEEAAAAEQDASNDE